MVEFPAIFGHEGAGIVRAIGSDVQIKDLQCGDSVLLSFTVCGECTQCKNDHPAYCHNHAVINHGAVRTDGSTPASLLDGRSLRGQYFGQSSFSRMSVVSEKSVVKCPYPESLSVYAPLGCGFQTGAGTIMNVLQPSKEHSVLICGLGSVGMAAVMAAKHMGANTIIAMDLIDAKLQMAEQLGATHLVNSKDTKNAVQTVKDITGGGANFAVDCTGVCAVVELLIDSLGPRGVAASVGVPPAGERIQIDALSFVLGNKTYLGVIEGDSLPSVVKKALTRPSVT